jgi:hypothetical protein
VAEVDLAAPRKVILYAADGATVLFPAVAAADNLANPTAPQVLAHLMGTVTGGTTEARARLNGNFAQNVAVLSGNGVTDGAAAEFAADAGAGAAIALLGIANALHNGATWDMQRGNVNATTGDTGAKTATFNGATQTNFNARGASILFNIGAVTGTTPTLAAKIQGSPDGGTTWYDIPGAVTPSIVATGIYLLTIYPAVTVAANAAVAYPLPRTWRAAYTIGGTTPSFTITNVQVAYIL